MPFQPLQGSDFLSCSICLQPYNEENHLPVTLGCGHTMCQACLWQLAKHKKCPHDQSTLQCNLVDLPINAAFMLLQDKPVSVHLTETAAVIIGEENMDHFEMIMRCFEELVLLLKPLAESILGTGSGNGNVLSRPMQRKLVTLIQCQLLEEDGRLRCLRASRSLGERTVIELIIQHQNPQQLASSLWAAVRSRGCQFLGPAMQEEVLRLILLALEDGSALSRKILVLFVVQRLENRFAQTSKTAVGHVVQLLYRASCFRVTKREDESSLMQLKDDFRQYETLRREHDAQIVQIAQESGLRIAPEHWAQLLYGDQTRKSHMQSIIDKLQSPQSFAQSISELLLALQRSGDPANLTRFQHDLELLSSIDGTSEDIPDWSHLSPVVSAVKICVFGLIDFIHHHVVRKPELPGGAHAIGKYKTSLCRDMIHRGTCPRGKACTFAHTDQEMERYRTRARRHSQRQCSTDLTASGNGLLGLLTDESSASRLHTSTTSTLSSSFQPPAGAAAAGPSTTTPQHYHPTVSTPNLAAPSTSQAGGHYTAGGGGVCGQYSSPPKGVGEHEGEYNSFHLHHYGSGGGRNYQAEQFSSQYLLNELRMRKEVVLAELELNRSNPRHQQINQGGQLHAQPPSTSVADSYLSSRAVNSLNLTSPSSQSSIPIVSNSSPGVGPSASGLNQQPPQNCTAGMPPRYPSASTPTYNPAVMRHSQIVANRFNNDYQQQHHRLTGGGEHESDRQSSSHWSTESTGWSHVSDGTSNCRSLESSASELHQHHLQQFSGLPPSYDNSSMSDGRFYTPGMPTTRRNGGGGLRDGKNVPSLGSSSVPRNMYAYNSWSTDSDAQSAPGGQITSNNGPFCCSNWMDLALDEAPGVSRTAGWNSRQPSSIGDDHQHQNMELHQEHSGLLRGTPLGGVEGVSGSATLSTSFPDGLASMGGRGSDHLPTLLSGEGINGLGVELIGGEPGDTAAALMRYTAPGGGANLSTSLGALTEQCAFQQHDKEDDKKEETAQFRWSGQQDEEVPFSAGPFVSKYGPISRKPKMDMLSGMNAIASLNNASTTTIHTTNSTLQMRPITTISMRCYNTPSNQNVAPFSNLDDRHRIERRITTLWDNGTIPPSSAAQQQVNLTAELVQINEQISVMEKDMRLQEELDALESLERRLDTEQELSGNLPSSGFDSSSSD